VWFRASVTNRGHRGAWLTGCQVQALDATNHALFHDTLFFGPAGRTFNPAKRCAGDGSSHQGVPWRPRVPLCLSPTTKRPAHPFSTTGLCRHEAETKQPASRPAHWRLARRCHFRRKVLSPHDPNPVLHVRRGILVRTNPRTRDIPALLGPRRFRYLVRQRITVSGGPTGSSGGQTAS
jgi:hypothetical protein